MKFEDYQELGLGFLLASSNNPPYLFSGLAGETGEIASLYAKSIRDHSYKMNTDSLAKDLGDLLWFIAAIATHYDLSLDDIAVDNITKLAQRRLNGTLQGSGDNR